MDPEGRPTARRVRLLLVSGSLRRASVNTATLRTAVLLAPAGCEAKLSTILASLPPFDPDADCVPLATPVHEWRDEIHTADAIVFSTPEYAGALPGAFKNLLDWSIGDDQPRSIYEKPVAWINTSRRGAQAAHDSLRTVLGYAHATIVERACVDVPIDATSVGDDGIVHDTRIRALIAGALDTLVAAVRDA